MNLRQIEVFAEVMRTGSITAAAEALHVSQPSVSKTIAYTEQKLGTKLFLRVGGKIVPTPEAIALYQETEQVMLALERFQDFCRDMKQLKHAPLSINAEALIGHVLVPDSISSFRKQWPEVRFKFEIHNAVNIANHVKWRQADLGLVHFPYHTPDLEAKILRKGTIKCVMRKDHSLAAKTTVTRQDLVTTDVIYCHGGIWMKQILEPQMPDKGDQIGIGIEVNQFANGCLLVQQNQGVMLVDDLACLGQSWPELIFLPFEPALEVALGVIHRKHEPLSQPATLFIEQLKATLSKLESA